MSKCSLCGGSRHRWDAERRAYVQCECLRGKRVASRYAEAGVPVRFADQSWKDLLARYEVTAPRALLGIARQLKQGEQPDQWPLLHGRPSRARQLVAALVLRSACDGELTARSVDVPALIDVEFERGRRSDHPEVDVLVIQVGDEPGNKWNRLVLEKVLRLRWAHGRFTMIVAEGELARIVSAYQSQQIEEALRDRFTRIRVTPKAVV